MLFTGSEINNRILVQAFPQKFFKLIPASQLSETCLTACEPFGRNQHDAPQRPASVALLEDLDFFVPEKLRRPCCAILLRPFEAT